jgi:LmbE family N-acetylglucosaminyl deacetylase
LLTLDLTKRGKSDIKILCLGSHSDDIEIGCGGTVLRLIERHRNLEFYWVVFSSNEERKREALRSACLFLKQAKRKTVEVRNFRNSFFPYEGAPIKEYFEQLKGKLSPDLIFTHYRNDLHQDHRLISELTWNTYRNHLILEYEIPKYDGDLGSPNLFVHLDDGVCRKKIEILLKVFRTQKDKQWFTRDSFLAMLRLRGIESNAPSKCAEAFYCRKLVI